MKKMPISQKRAKKLAKNPDATVGLLAGHSDEVYTDGNDVVIEMEEVDAAPTPAPKSPAVTTATSPNNSTGPAAVNKGSETQPPAMVEVVTNQFDIPESVRIKMSQHAPRFVCMGEGDASGHQFVQFLYSSEDEAKAASSFLNRTFNINKKGQDNRVFACSKKPQVFPMFARLKLFRVTIFKAKYFEVFGNNANPTMSRMGLENALAEANGQQPPHNRGKTQSRAAPRQQPPPHTGSSHSSTPLTKVTHQEPQEEEDLYALLSDDRKKDSGSESDRSDGEHLEQQGRPAVRVAITPPPPPSQGVQVVSQRKDKEEASAGNSVDTTNRRAAEAEPLLEAPGARTKKDHRKASKPAVVIEDAVDQQDCVLM